MDVINVFLLALAGGVLSLTGGFILLKNAKLAKILSQVSAPFAAGALLAAVFFDVLPEALEIGEMNNVFIWLLIGIVGFFILERRLNWFHHHHEHEADTNVKKRTPAMLVVGDTLHNAIDGAAIGIAYLADPMLGVVTAIAVALHEIPQEIGDFGLLLKAGWNKNKVLKVNLLSALACVATALATYFIGTGVEQIIAPALGLVSGMLLYIALSDVLPSVHDSKNHKKWLDKATLLFLSGIFIVWGAITLTHSVFDVHLHEDESNSEIHSDEHDEEHEEDEKDHKD